MRSCHDLSAFEAYHPTLIATACHQGLEMSRMELDHLRPWRMRLNRLQKPSLAVAWDVWVAITDDEDAVRCE